MSSSERPEFFFDRSLGVGPRQRCASTAGWSISWPTTTPTTQTGSRTGVEDTEWIAEGCSRGWALLTKDKRIRYRRHELGALHGRLFALSRGDLTVSQAATRIVAAAPRIELALAAPHGLWLVYDSGRIERRWP